MATIKVKWGKELLQLTVNPQTQVGALKEELQKMTLVPIERQKLMGLKPNPLGDNATLADVGVTEGKMLMLLGTTAEPPTAKKPPPPNNNHTPGAEPNATAMKLAHPTSPMPVGLKNIANTCYMNAALQMLHLVPELPCILEARGSEALLRTLNQVYKSMDTSKEPFVPLLFWNAFIGQNPSFGELDDHGHPMQHDSQEVLNIILQQIQNGIPEAQKNLFSGMLKQTTTCKETTDDAPTVREIPFFMLSCNINAEVQMLETGLDAGFNETIPIYSDKLAREALYSRTSRLSTLPEYLFVHLVRFSWRADTQKKAKILKPISFPLVLDVLTLCTDELKEDMKGERANVMVRREKELERRREARQKTRLENTTSNEETPIRTSGATNIIGNISGYYDLCGVISHKGRSADSGHYVFWGKPAGDQWLVYDDENVASVTEEDVKRLSGVGEAHIAYVLMYRSKDPLTKATTIPL